MQTRRETEIERSPRRCLVEKRKLHKNMCRGFPGGPVVKTAFAAVDLGLIPSDQGTKIPQATWSGTKRRKKKHVQ